MRFEWDAQNIEHVAAHGLTPALVEAVVLAGGFVTSETDGARIVGHGAHKGRTYRIVFTHVAADVIRVITAHRIDPRRIR